MQAKIFNSHFRVDEAGNAYVKVVFDGLLTREDKVSILAQGLAKAENSMKGQETGKNNGAHWEKLISENKLPYGEDSEFGSMQTTAWLNGYLGKEEDVTRYVRQVNETVSKILSTPNFNGIIPCPQCGKLPFNYVVGSFSVTGVCKNGCGFRLNNFHKLTPAEFKYLKQK